MLIYAPASIFRHAYFCPVFAVKILRAKLLIQKYLLERVKIARSAEVFSFLDLEIASIPLKYLKKPKYCQKLMKITNMEELISALFPCFWGKAYLCPPPGGGGFRPEYLPLF